MKQSLPFGSILKCSFWLLFITICLQTQLKAQGDVQLWFYDPCKDEVIENWYFLHRDNVTAKDYKRYESNKAFKIKNVPAGSYSVQLVFERGEESIGVEFRALLEIGSNGLADTLNLSRILKSLSGVDSNTVFLNCDRRCQGEEREVDENGVMRLEGNFDNGIAEVVSYFDENGLLTNKYWYKPGDAAYVRREWYDEGELIEIRVRERINKKKVMEYFYNPDSTLSYTFKARVSQERGW